jgi:hypothetical protein
MVAAAILVLPDNKRGVKSRVDWNSHQANIFSLNALMSAILFVLTLALMSARVKVLGRQLLRRCHSHSSRCGIPQKTVFPIEHHKLTG